MLQLLSYSHFFSHFCISWKSRTILFVSNIENIRIFYNTSFRGRKPDSDTGNEKDDHPSPAYLPSAFESGLGQQEYQNVVSNVVDLANPSTVSPATGRQR